MVGGKGASSLEWCANSFGRNKIKEAGKAPVGVTRNFDFPTPIRLLNSSLPTKLALNVSGTRKDRVLQPSIYLKRHDSGLGFVYGLGDPISNLSDRCRH